MVDAEAPNWRDRRYGRISGLAIERSLAFYDQMNELKASLQPFEVLERYARIVRFFSSVPNWANYYTRPFLELLGVVVGSAGLSEVVASAAKSPEPQIAFIDAASTTPLKEGLSPSVMSAAFAMIGNMEAIGRYSMSINDMLRLAAERNDPQLIRQAISVDAYVLTLPMVIAQLRIGQMFGDMSGPEIFISGLRGPDKRRAVYTKLRWLEYLLREMGAFEACTEAEIHDLVVTRLGLYDDDTKLGDSKKALAALFRKWQKAAGN